jgi:lipopolysaccharide transport system ATP-binding protein
VPEPAIRGRNLYKKFRKGEMYDSLRDLLPALVRRKRPAANGELREREFWALRDVSFEVARGEAFGVIGHNGAGKSTLLKHLCGIMKPTRGSLEVRGRLSALIEVGAGFHDDLTGRENIFLNGTILGMTREEVRRKFDAIVEFSGLEEFIDTPVKRYSSGMYARLGFAVAVHVEPDVLVVDEVLSVGDYLFQRKGLEKMESVVTSGTTVVFVSHNLHAVASLCQRAMLMERGSVVTIGPVADVIRTYLERGATVEPASHEDKEAYLSRIVLRGESGESLRFESGQRVFLDLDVTARRPCEKMAVVIECIDEEQYQLFNTSTQRLGEPPFDLEAGETLRTTFELRLNLAPGTFQLGAHVYRYDNQHNFDTRLPAATFYVTSATDVRGVAHLEPRVVRQEKVRAAQ